MTNRTLKKRAYEFKLTRVCETGPSFKVDTPEAAYDYWQSSLQNRSWFQANKEHLVTLFLNARYHIEGHNLVSIGSVNQTVAHPREILAPVICSGCFSFMMMHNHPSGDPSPSEPDRRLTRKLDEFTKLIDIEMLDHVIIGKTDDTHREPFFSFREMGLL